MTHDMSRTDHCTLREALGIYPALAWLADKTATISPVGRRMLLDSAWLTDAVKLRMEYDATECLRNAINRSGKIVDTICLRLMRLRDIASTLSALASGQTMGDIELFEVKSLAMISDGIRQLLNEASIDVVTLPDVTDVVRLLDPENSGVAHFYVYDTYSATLKTLRKKLKQARLTHSVDEGTIYAECSDEEYRIRRELTHKLADRSQVLSESLAALGRLDVLIARARTADDMGLTRPRLTHDTTAYRQLRNPQVAEALEKHKRGFQPVDIDIHNGVTVITGANMAGKSVVLKTVAMSQLMAQFGFYVPARKADIVPVERVMTSIGDGQSELEGMSSYAAEMLRIDNIIKKIRNGERVLALIDEPARTTNPEEGKALVNAIISLLDTPASQVLITTHYSGLEAPCRHLRVHGFREELAGGKTLTAASVNDYIDYTLEESTDSDVPREALRIARLIGVDTLVAETAARYLDHKPSLHTDAEE